MTRNKLALVIGAGSVKCAAAVGLLKALRREGIEIDLLVGCSGGSIYAEIIPILPRFERQIVSFGVHENPHIIEQGERAAEEQLLYIQRVLEIL